MARKNPPSVPATIGHSDDYLDRREELLERQRAREDRKFKQQERELRRQLHQACW